MGELIEDEGCVLGAGGDCEVDVGGGGGCGDGGVYKVGC